LQGGRGAGYGYNDYDDYGSQEDEEDGPGTQLLTEYYTSFTKTEDEDVSFVQITVLIASNMLGAVGCMYPHLCAQLINYVHLAKYDGNGGT
jgi:hypothetical protein